MGRGHSDDEDGISETENDYDAADFPEDDDEVV